MTPEREHVWIGYCDLCNGQHCITIKDADAKVERRPHIHPEVRAALRERDAAWASAASRVGICSECNEAFAFRPIEKPCRFCAPLRALLEEAGK